MQIFNGSESNNYPILRVIHRNINDLINQNDSETNPSNPVIPASFDEKGKLYQLTRRETEIVKFILKGARYKAIAQTLFISEKTVSKHIQNIFEKVGVTNKVELINKLKS